MTAGRSSAWTCTAVAGVLVRMTEDGRRLGTARITNSPEELRREVSRAGKSPRIYQNIRYG